MPSPINGDVRLVEDEPHRSDVTVHRLPVVAMDGRVIGYSVTITGADPDGPDVAEALYLDLDLANMVADRYAFMPATRAMLEGYVPTPVVPGRLVLDLPRGYANVHGAVGQAAARRTLGMALCMPGFTGEPRQVELLPCLAFVVVDAHGPFLSHLVHQAHSAGVRVLATGADTMEVQDACRAAGVDGLRLRPEPITQGAGQLPTQRGIREANQVRRLLAALRQTVYTSPGAPLPALEMLVAEMLAIHFCSDREETIGVLTDLLAEAEARLRQSQFVVAEDAVRVFWVNPVADLRAMNLLEDWGGRICGSDYMFTHALDLIPEDLPPLEALARTALADPMVGSTLDRARRIVADCRACRAEAVVVSRIPGASHCAREGAIIREVVRADLGIPTIELEVPPICDAMLPTLSSRLQALLETARSRR